MNNLLIITPDQLRADRLGCYGGAIATPNIDAMAASGVAFEQCYCAAPLCGPSRISFATSTYLSEHNHRNYWSTISPDVPNLALCLKRAGARTGMFGKNHLFTYSRLREVWDELDEICLGNYDGHPLYRHSFSSFTLADGHPFNVTGRLTDETIDFIGRCGEKPFFAWVNYQDPHPAFTCPKPYDTMFRPEDMTLPDSFFHPPMDEPARCGVWRTHSEMDLCTEQAAREALAHYMGQVRYVDDSVGRIIDALRRSGQLEHTVVLFFSDHGELLGDRRMFHKIPVFYDCLARIPVVLRFPGGPAGMRFRGLTEEIDLAPTLLDLMGVEIPPTMCGVSLKASLLSGDDTGREDVLCEAGGGAPTCKAPIPGLKLLAPHVPTSFGPGAMLRTARYKLSVYTDDRGELYDMETDPDELNNLYGDAAHADVRAELTERLLRRLLAVKVRRLPSLEWDTAAYPQDVRFEPLEMAAGPTVDIRLQSAGGPG